MSLKIQYFPEKFTGPADLVICDLHGYDRENITGDEQLTERWWQASREKNPENLLQKYLGIECDFGIHDFVQKIPRKILATVPNLKIKVIQVQTNRGVLDANRWSSDRGVRRTFSAENFPDLESDLVAAHEELIKNIWRELEVLKDGGQLFIPHTMNRSCFCPRQFHAVHQESAEILSKYVEARTLGGIERSDSLINRTPEQNFVGSEALSAAFKDTFHASNLTLRENHPYPAEPYILATKLMEHYPDSIALEICKHNLALSTDSHDSSTYQISAEKIDQYTELCAQIFINERQGRK